METLSDSEEYSEIKEAPFELVNISQRDYLIILFSVIAILFYFTIPVFQSFIELNIAFVKSNIDVLFFFMVSLGIPFILYVFFLILRIIKKIWGDKYSFTRMRVYLTITRKNIVWLGSLMMLLAILTPFTILSKECVIIASLSLILLNYYFIDYSPVWEEQKYYEAQRRKGEKEDIPISVFVAYALFPCTLIFLGLYFGNTFVNNAVNSFFQNYILIDPGFLTIMIVCILFSPAWFMVSWVLVMLIRIYENYKEKFHYIIRLVWFLCFLYFLLKLSIFNFTKDLEEPYATITSLSLSAVGGLVMKISKNKSKYLQNID